MTVFMGRSFFYLILSVVLISLLSGLFSCKRESDVYFAELDELVRNSKPYEQNFQRRLDSLKCQYRLCRSDSLKFRIAEGIFDMYRNFRIDSALVFADSIRALSKGMGDYYVNRAEMHYADALNKFGRHDEAIRVLDNIERTDSVRVDNYFYYLYHTALSSLLSNISNEEERKKYNMMLKAYNDTSLIISHQNSEEKFSNRAWLLAKQGNRKEALSILLDYYKSKEESSEVHSGNMASVEFQIANLYLLEKDTVLGIEYLKRASISDLKQSKRVYMSLWRLAEVLYQKGDVDRSYLYVNRSLRDVSEGKARYRMYDVVKYMPIISESYEQSEDIADIGKFVFMTAIVLIALIMALAYWLVRRRNSALAAMHKQLNARNAELMRLAGELKESNQIKVKYMALLFNICSDIIRENEAFKKNMLRKLSVRKLAEMEKMLEKSDENKDFKKLIQEFDTIFLSIFPNFVSDFNNLLRPEERIVLKHDKLLTPELRIYALIRLGITENAQIAEFLHYSIQTVYNYRQRMRNKALVKGKSLSAQMQKILGGV